VAENHDGLSSTLFAAGQRLDWRAWGDELVVYDDRTAQTHLLHWPAAAALAALLRSSRPLSTRELLGHLLEGDAGASPDDADAAQAVLDGLHEAGLIERCSP
jgi:PqqD family protein of HPr-rel-A system